MERTLILVKPDAFERGLTGEIIARFERKGLRIRGLKLMQLDRDAAERIRAMTGAVDERPTSSVSRLPAPAGAERERQRRE